VPLAAEKSGIHEKQLLEKVNFVYRKVECGQRANIFFILSYFVTHCKQAFYPPPHHFFRKNGVVFNFMSEKQLFLRFETILKKRNGHESNFFRQDTYGGLAAHPICRFVRRNAG
jgi:hypothetical protein